ncbi:MAG TPA: hypothetical protein VFP45_04940 [Candidatus Nitrosotalea sp.]|nr:hypothetical protein [Candidatus Nitrosotalea sp.]
MNGSFRVVNHFDILQIMLALNIMLVIVGIVIPIGTTIFWSVIKKTLSTKFDNRSHDGVVFNEGIFAVAQWMYHHRSKFNIIVTMIVTVIEFFALVQF